MIAILKKIFYRDVNLPRICHLCYLVNCQNKEFPSLPVLNEIPHNSLDEWFFGINTQYKILNQFSASFAWELSVNPTKEMYDEASEFGGLRSRWRNSRCSEAKRFFKEMSSIQKRMIHLLCRGPKYTDYQASELSVVLSRMQDIYTETQVCLPVAFDICLNYNRIWNYTYLRTINDEIIPLHMNPLAPDESLDHNPLHYFNGELSPDYYVLRGVQNDKNLNPDDTDNLIRQGQVFCLGVEPDLERIMQGNFTYLQRPDCALPADTIFRWAWEAWRLAVGPSIRELYPTATYLMNLGARNNGYNDIGECWREELEMKDSQASVTRLWNGIKPVYQLLHAVLRNALWNKYDGESTISRKGPLPAHLLGNMWSQDWSAYHKLLMPFSGANIDENFRNTNWTTLDMVRRAEDFYSSMGLNPMTKKFWTLSKFDKTSNTTKCHGSAANMFTEEDYRMIVCADKSIDDFYVITHEMGHIQYYMHFNHQPAIFQEATNSAFGETFGDAIFLAMMTPQHLNRLSLLPDKDLFRENIPHAILNEMRLVHEREINPEFMKAPSDAELQKATNHGMNYSKVQRTLYDLIKEKEIENNDETLTMLGKELPNFDDRNERVQNYLNFKANYDQTLNTFDLSLLLRLALSKIPQIPFEYILDIFRWDVFSGKVPFEDANDYFWKIMVSEQGIHPPDWKDRHNLFDPAAKFHVADNTPYVRYFLASFLQAQVFKGLCEKTVFGRVNTKEKLPMPLHRCDIYGSKRAGSLLKKAMKLGASAHWSEVLYILTGKRTISIEPLLEYYRPLIIWLEKLVIEFDIPVGW